jgi:hypothetical protein
MTITPNVLLTLFMIIFPSTSRGGYNISTGVVEYCDTAYVCLHELGHKIDVGENGYAFWMWRSADGEFRVYVDENYDKEYSYVEMYAKIYADVGGSTELPEELFEFYH